MNTVQYTVTAGFAVTIRRQHNEHRYSPSIASFMRYVAALKRMNWTEKRYGLGISLREPPQ